MENKKVISGIEIFDKGVKEIGKLGSIVDSFNLTIKDVSEALMIIGDQEEILNLNEACKKAIDELNELHTVFDNINKSYNELIGLSLYKDNLLDEIKELKEDIKNIKLENKIDINKLRKDIKNTIQESIESLKSDNELIIQKVENIINNTVIKTENISFDDSYYKDLAIKYISNKEYIQALDCYNKVINFKIENNKSYDKEDYLNRANILEILGRYEEAMKDYKRASEI